MKRRRSLAEYIIRKLLPLMECHLVEANPYGIDKKLYGKNNKAKESKSLIIQRGEQDDTILLGLKTFERVKDF